MKEKLQLFISYCGADKPKKDALKGHLITLQEEYAKRGVHLEICEMETHCAGAWDKWMISAIKESDVVICILEDSIFTEKEKAEKRILEELRVARDENKGIVPLILTERELPDEYKAHIGRLSQVWYTYENGNEEQAYAQATEKAKILLDGVLKGDKVDQGDSVRILSGVATKNEKFVGREKEMAWLREKLLETNVVILKGEGGIGKTSLAENFFHQNSDLYSRAYVVTASNGVRKGICNVDFESTRHIKDEEERYPENYRLLSALSEKTIIILDNCDEEVSTDELSQIVNQMKCRFMITSRVGNEDFEDYTLDVGKMMNEDLLSLTYKHYPQIVKDNGGNKGAVESKLINFFQAVGGHTMAVEMAAAIMRDGDIPVEKISEAILSCNEKCKTRHNKEKRASAVEHLKVLYNYASVTPTQEEILSAVCLIEPSVGIPRRDLKELLALDDNNEINELVNKTFLRMQERIVSMHPLFSDVFYQQNNVAEKKEQNAEVIDYLLGLRVDEYNVEENEQLILLLYFLIEKRASAFSDTIYGKEQFANVYYDLAYGLTNVVCYTAARDCLLTAVEILESIPDSARDEKLLANVYNSLGRAYANVGEYGNGLEYTLKALRIREKLYADNPNHPELSTSHGNAGSLYGLLGDYKKALEHDEKALQIDEAVYAETPNHCNLALSYNNIGNSYTNLGEHEKALEYQLKAMKIYETVHADNPNHPDLALIYNNVGGTYGELGDKEKKLEYRLKAMKIYETVHADNPNHPDLALIYNNIGVAYGELGEREKQLEYQLRSARIREVIYADNPNHPDLALVYNNIGVTYGELGDEEKSLEYKFKALKIYETVYADNPNHPDLALSYNNIGCSYNDLGEPEKALEYRLKALRIYETVYADNPNRLDLALIYSNVGIVYGKLSDYENELQYKLKAMKIYETVYVNHPNHPDLLLSYNSVGIAYDNLGEYEKAIEYKLKVLRIRERIYADNPNHPDFVKSYNTIAYSYGELKNHEKALEYYLKVLHIHEEVYADNPMNLDLANSYSNVACMYGNIGDCEKALEYYLKGLHIEESIYADNPKNSELANSYFNVACTYDDLGDYETAIVYYEKARDAFEDPEDIDLAEWEIQQMREKTELDLALKYYTEGDKYLDVEDYEKALESCLKAMEIYERVFANDPIQFELSAIYYRISYTYGKLGDHENELWYALKALDIDEELCIDNPEDVDLGDSYFSVACAYEHLGNYEQALFYYQKARDAFEKPDDIELTEWKIGEMQEALDASDEPQS